jgi:hemerythrin
MSLFRWGKDHEIFLPEVDAEHRSIFQAGEELHRLLNAGAGTDTIQQALNHLAQLAEAHFQHEERLMKQSAFESRRWHVQQHDAVRKRAAQIDVNSPETVAAFLAFLAAWLGDHASVADRIMASHVRNWWRGKAA